MRYALGDKLKKKQSTKMMDIVLTVSQTSHWWHCLSRNCLDFLFSVTTFQISEDKSVEEMETGVSDGGVVDPKDFSYCSAGGLRQVSEMAAAGRSERRQ